MSSTITLSANTVAKWAKCLEIIKDNVNFNIYQQWFEELKLVSFEGNLITLRVNSHFHYEYLEANYINLLSKVITKIFGSDTKMQYSTLVDKRDSLQVNIPATNTHITKNPVIEVPPSDSPKVNPWVRVGIPTKTRINSNLNPRCTFNNFVEGECNILARSAGLEIALKPGETPFNPLFLHCGTGLGKSHLLHAIGMLTKEHHPNLNVLYTNWEDFTRQWVEASKNSNSITEFTNFYHSIDVLLLDDINNVKNRPATQDAFFNIFNDLHNRHKQIVMASDRMPSDLEGLEKRLLSRFKWGLPAELFMPDIETRMKILKQKIVDNGIISIPDEVIEYIALVATTNIRELEGMLNSILARAILCKEPTAITLELAKSIIDNFVRNSEKEISIDYIKNIVCDYFTVPISEVFSKGRKREIVQARQLIMYFAKKHSNSSLQSIGLQCGNRDHATVLHACKTVTDLLDSDKNFKTYVDDLSRRINM